MQCLSITVGECHMMCSLVGPTPNCQLNVSPRYILMHKGGNKLTMNLNIAGLFLQETYTSTDTRRHSWVSMGVGSRMNYIGLGVGGSVETE